MAKKSKVRRGRGRSFTLPLAVVAGMAPGVMTVANGARAGGVTEGAKWASRIYTGYEPTAGKVDLGYLKWGAVPLLMGLVAHYLAGRLGINRALGRAGIPVIRL